jgi:predicted dehydrogenase
MDIRIGMLGFGFMGKTHAYAVENLKYFYKNLPFTARITALCTAHKDTSCAACAEYGFDRACGSEDEIISDPDIDAVDVCTPNIFHYETVKKILRAKKHIMCEKPLAVTYEEAAELARLADEAGVTTQIVFNNRYMAPVLRAKQLIDSGRLGDIIGFRSAYLHNSCMDPNKPAGWKQTGEYGGGVLRDLGSHAIDLVYYLCGDFERVSGKSLIYYRERAGMDGAVWKTTADEAFYITAQLKSGAIGTIEANKLTVGVNDDLSIFVHGTRGSLRFSLMDPNFLEFYDGSLPGGDYGGDRGVTRIECVNRYPEPGGVFPGVKAPVGWLRGHVGNMYNFCSAVYEGRQAAPSFFDGARISAVIDAAERSDRADGAFVAVAQP